MYMHDKKPPIAERASFPIEIHGEKRDDPYAWLKDANWQAVMKTPSQLQKNIREYLEAENMYTDGVMASTAELQKSFYDEMRGRIEENKSSPGMQDGPWLYYTRLIMGGEYHVYCRKLIGIEGAIEEVLFDGNREAEGKSHFAVRVFTHSPDHRYIAYSLDLNGSELYTLYIKDLNTGLMLSDEVQNVSDVVWAQDSKTIAYARVDANHRPLEVYRHILGRENERNELVYKEYNEGFFVYLRKTQSGKFIVITASSHDTSEEYLIPALEHDVTPVLVAQMEEGVKYSSDHSSANRLIILTNAFGAEDFQIMGATIGKHEKKDWYTLVPHRHGILISELIVFQDYIVRLESENALPRIVIRGVSDGVNESVVDFNEEAYSISLVRGYEFNTHIMRFMYSSPTTPRCIFDYDMRAGTRQLVDETRIPSGHDPKKYIAKRISAPSHDGVNIPVTLLYRRDLTFDVPPPCYLYGYGSYGYTMDSDFDANVLSLVERGFVYAVAHVRGGMECGYHWYVDGKLNKKKNTFLDFIAVAEELVRRGYAAPKQIAIEGGSAGGMLVGAVSNMRPDLWGVVIARVPFVDVLNTMCDNTLPLTPLEWPEWGNPILDKDAFTYIKSYSPYDNVVATAYPHMLVTAGLTDPRVTYWEPAKWVARLRHENTSGSTILFKTEMEHGHQGSTGRFKSLEDRALAYSFVVSGLENKLG